MLERPRVFRKLVPVVAIAAGVALMAAPASGDREDDQRIAEDAALTLADLPDGWEAEPSDDLGEEIGLDGCKAIDRVNRAGVRGAHEETPMFVDANDPTGSTSIEGAVFVFPKAKGAKRYVKAYAADAALDCLDAVGEAALAGLPSSNTDLAAFDVDAGDRAVGYRLELEGTDEAGTTDRAVLDLVVVRQGRAIATLGGQGEDDPPPIDDLVDEVLDRLEQEL